jgi:hypothetical protein
MHGFGPILGRVRPQIIVETCSPKNNFSLWGLIHIKVIDKFEFFYMVSFSL